MPAQKTTTKELQYVSLRYTQVHNAVKINPPPLPLWNQKRYTVYRELAYFVCES
jgi:hypothetical protein